MDVVPDQRWARLLAEHERNERARDAIEWAELDGLSFHQRLGRMLGFGGLVVAAFIALLVGLVVGAWSVVSWTRLDPARCPGTYIEAVRTEIHLGGWAEPDSCTYYDEAGAEIRSDSHLAGPVLRSANEGIEKVVVTGAACVVLLASGGGLLFAVRRRQGAGRSR